ncbi:hypothetical protein [Kaarinaea lacus]
MNSRYIIKDGEYYLLLEPSQTSREVANLYWCIEKANERIAEISEVMALLDDASHEYDILEEEANDLRLLIDDFSCRCEDIKNLPALDFPSKPSLPNT